MEEQEQFKFELLHLLARHNAVLEIEDSFFEGKRIIAVLNSGNVDLGNYVGLDNVE
jgi:hypothetical protein